MNKKYIYLIVISIITIMLPAIIHKISMRIDDNNVTNIKNKANSIDTYEVISIDSTNLICYESELVECIVEHLYNGNFFIYDDSHISYYLIYNNIEITIYHYRFTNIKIWEITLEYNNRLIDLRKGEKKQLIEIISSELEGKDILDLREHLIRNYSVK